MPFSVEWGNLFLYTTQQLGVMLGVGAQTVLLVGYLLSMRDGKLEEKEAQFGRAVNRVLRLGLLCIVLSGVAITAIHFMLGESDVVFSPAYLFKWLLIVIAAVATTLQGKLPYPHYLVLGFVGASWYGIFVVHVLAPVTTWIDLGILYTIWIIGFVFVWIALVMTFRERGTASVKAVLTTPAGAVASVVAVAPKPKTILPKKETPPVLPKKEPTPTAAPPPKKPVPHINLSAAIAPQLSSALPAMPTDFVFAPAPHKPSPISVPVPRKPEEENTLPALRVMPRTPEEAQKHI